MPRGVTFGWCKACGKFRQHLHGQCAMTAYHRETGSPRPVSPPKDAA